MSSVFFFFKQKAAYEVLRSLGGSGMCIRDNANADMAPHIGILGSRGGSFWVVGLVWFPIIGVL